MNRQWIHEVLQYDPHLSAVSFLVNSIHLVVLIQKSMRTSSTNIILLAIAISNLVYMAYPIINGLKMIYDSTKPCILPDSYAYVVFNWIYFSIQDDVRRCDAFLGLAMASIRTFVLKYPMKSDTAASVSFGWKTCLIIFLLSSIISSMHFLTTQINPVNYLRLKCQKGFSNDTSAIINSATSKLVFLNTIVYVVSALPSGILYILHSYDIPWFVKVGLTDFVFALGFLTSLMTLTHFPICLAMSTQYQSTVVELLRIKKESGTTIIKANSISENVN